MHNSQTSQCDPPQQAKPTYTYDLHHAGFMEGNNETKNEKYINTK
jgi:hypothetical protein